MSAKFTPGPWKAVLDKTTDDFCIEHEAFEVCRIARCFDLHTAQQNRANAALIAAAPDLLAAIQALFEHCAMIHKRWGEGGNQKEADAAIEQARAAVRKATGND